MVYSYERMSTKMSTFGVHRLGWLMARGMKQF